MLVSGSHPPPQWSDLMLRGGNVCRCKLTLTGNFNVVTDADSLAVPKLFALGLAKTGVAVVLKVSHDCRGWILLLIDVVVE